VTDAGFLFEEVGQTDIEPEEIERARLRPGCVAFVSSDGFEALVPEDLLHRAGRFARDAAPREFFALLMVRECFDGLGPYVRVVGLVPDLDADAGRAAIATTAASEAATSALAHRLFPEATKGGTLHSHPRMGTRASGTDRANQRTWRRPGSLSVIVDPWAPEFVTVYRGPGSERLRPCGTAGPAPGAEPEAPPAPQPPPAPGGKPRRRRPRALFALGLLTAVALFSWGVGRVARGIGAVVGEARAQAAALRSLQADVEAMKERSAATPADRAPPAPSVCVGAEP
jgi:pyruvate/2-oxoglutarate dehydrogenase complex dihydrolipoamide acyltransferase (E2) component